MKFFYRAFGLVIGSQIECPELMPAAEQSSPDVSVRYGEAPLHLDGVLPLGSWIEGRKGQILLTIDGVARYLVQEGVSVTADAHENALSGDVRLFLLGSAMGAILHQRGLLPFHGSSICTGGRAVTFSGPPGIGKSTLAATLVDRGYMMLADDVSAISFTGSGLPVVNPGMPQLKLRDDAMQQLGRDIHRARPLGNHAGKYGCSEHAAFMSDVLSLKTVYILGKHPGKKFENIPLKGTDKFIALRNNTYRPSFVKAMGIERQHFDLLQKLAAHIDVHVLLRPAEGFRIDELADYVSQLIAK